MAQKPVKTKRGPKAETVKIKGNWEDAVKKSFQKNKLPGGRPKLKWP